MIGKVVRAGRGSQTYGIAEGDRVCTIDFDLGGQSKYVVVPCYDLIPVPPSVGESTHAVCALRAYVMALQCLYHVGDRPLFEGDRVLVVGGTGAIGQAVVELALEGGARFVYATGTGNNVSRLYRSKGVRLLDRDPSKWLPDVEGNMDIVVDLVGLDGYAASIKAVKGDGTGKVVCAGTPNDQNENSIGNLVVNAATNLIQNVSTYDFFASIENDPETYKEDLRQVFLLLKQKKISPRISKFALLNEVASAHEAIEAGGLDGHVICRPNPTKKFVYNIKAAANDEVREGIVDTRDDDMSFMLDERSYVSNEDRSEYSRSVISKVASGESDFTDFTSGTYGTYDDDLSYNMFGFFSGKKKKEDLAKPSKDTKALNLLGGISALAAIGENVASRGPAKSVPVDDGEEDETQVGSIRTNQSPDVVLLSYRHAKTGEGSSITSTPLPSSPAAPEAQTTPGVQRRNSMKWLKRIPSFSKKKAPTGLQTTNLNGDHSAGPSPIASETVIKAPSPRNAQADDESPTKSPLETNVEPNKNVATDECPGFTEADPSLASQERNGDEDSGPMDLFGCVACLCSAAPAQDDTDDHSIAADEINQLQDTELQNASDENGEVSLQKPGERTKTESETCCPSNSNDCIVESAASQALPLFAQEVTKDGVLQDEETPDLKVNLNNIADEHKTEKRGIADGGVSGAFQDLFGLGLCSQPSSPRKESDKPAQITILQEQGDEPSALEVDLGIAATPSCASDGSSTYVTTGIVLNQPNRESMTLQTAPLPDLPKIQRMPISDEVSALTGVTMPMRLPREKVGIPLKLPSFGRARSMSRSKGLVKTPTPTQTPTPLVRSQSALSHQRSASRSTARTTTTGSSAVSIKCGDSQRQFHIPSTVASSAMTVASSQSTSSKRSRNIYAKSSRPQQGGGSPAIAYRRKQRTLNL